MKIKQQSYKKNTKYPAISIEDVASVAYKIGKDIWGEDEFLKLMGITNNPLQSNIYTTNKQEIA